MSYENTPWKEIQTSNGNIYVNNGTNSEPYTINSLYAFIDVIPLQDKLTEFCNNNRARISNSVQEYKYIQEYPFSVETSAARGNLSIEISVRFKAIYISGDTVAAGVDKQRFSIAYYAGKTSLGVWGSSVFDYFVFEGSDFSGFTSNYSNPQSAARYIKDVRIAVGFYENSDQQLVLGMYTLSTSSHILGNTVFRVDSRNTDYGNKVRLYSALVEKEVPVSYYNIINKIITSIDDKTLEEGKPVTPINPAGEGGDPYEKDPDSQGNNDPGGHKGGDGKYQDTDEDVPIPGLPQISAVDTGLCTLLNPTNEQLEQLSEFLWSDVFSIDSFKKIFADPMDVILGLSIVPLKVASDILRRVKISGIDTGVEMYKCASQYIEVDCGSIDITNYWDNFMDYEPYTQYTIYLPYVGYKVLHADELVDKTITVKYHCDILSGACMAYVQCGKKVLYCFEGNISIQIPVTSASYDNMIHGMLQVASGVGQIIAGGASMAAGGAGAGLMVSGAVGTATGATSAIKPTIGRSGNAESSTGLMGIQKPYLIISRPRAVVPSGLNKYSGYPAYKGGKLGDFNNFTVVQDIRIKNLNGATMEEMNEAERLCKEGVIV